MHDRRDRVEEGEFRLAGELARIACARAGEVSGPVAMMTWSQSAGGRPAISLASHRRSVGSSAIAAVTARRKAVAIDRESAASRHLMGVGGSHDKGAERPHLAMQDADGVGLRDRRNGTNWSRPVPRSVGLVRLRRSDGPHFVQHDGHAARAICQAASEPARPPPMTWTGCCMRGFYECAPPRTSAYESARRGRSRRAHHACTRGGGACG